MSQPRASSRDPVVYATYLLMPDRSPLNWQSERWDRFVADVALYGDDGIKLCLDELGRRRSTWKDALERIATNRNAYWQKNETPLESRLRVRYGFTAIVNQLHMRRQIAVLPPLLRLDTARL